MTGCKIPTRKAFGEELSILGSKNKDIVVLEADISKSTYTCLFAEKHPSRFFNIGVAEQNMMGIAAGLASTGLIPVVSTYAVFASMRACEQLRTSICYPELDVKICVSHGGITPGTDGATHQATEDLSMMRSIPGLKVIMPCDAPSTKAALRDAVDTKGPVYIRLTREAVPQIYDHIENFKIGRSIILKDGSDASIVAVGDMVCHALKAAEILAAQNISCRVIDMHTIKPLDQDEVIRSAKKTGLLVTAEDNNILGGLGGAIAETVSESYPVPVLRIGLKDTFAESGSYENLLKKYDMDHLYIASKVKEGLKLKKMKGKNSGY
jgi:transketolase